MKPLRVAFTNAIEDQHSGEKLHHVKEIVKEAKRLKADLVCFGECYPIQTSDPETEKKGIEYLKKISKDSGLGLIIGVGTPEYNKMMLISQGKVIGEQLKGCFFANEKRRKKAKQYTVFRFKNFKIGLLVCYDLFFPENARKLYEERADLIVCGANAFQGQTFWEPLALIRSMENQIPVIISGKTNPKHHLVGPGVLALPNNELFTVPTKKELTVVTVDLGYWKELRKQKSNPTISAWDYIQKGINGPFVKDYLK